MSGPSLSPYYGSLSVGTPYKIQAKAPWYSDVGTGSFSKLSADEIAFSGKINFFGQTGNISLDLNVTNANAGTISFNGKAESCTFTVNSPYLVCHLRLPGSGLTTLQIEWWHKGLWIGGPGTPHDIWVGA